jgi:hypothetical protein
MQSFKTSKTFGVRMWIILFIAIAVISGSATAQDFWQQHPTEPDMIFYPGPVGIGFNPVTGEQHLSRISLQLAKDFQTNTWVYAGDGVAVNLSIADVPERGGFSLLRSGTPLGELVLETNDDVALVANNNLYLRTGGSVIANEIIVQARGADFVFAKDIEGGRCSQRWNTC